MPPIDIRQANEAWESVLTAHAVLMRDFAAESIWNEHDLSMREYDVLYTLAKCNEPARLGDLHGSVLLSQPALSRLVDRLVARELIERVTDPSDRRAVRLSLTSRGRQVQVAVGRAHARSVAAALTPLNSDEQRQLEHLARKLATQQRGNVSFKTKE